jgi:oligoendopeptidase F
MLPYNANIKKLERVYLPKNLTIKDWTSIEPYFTELLNREVKNVTELEQWLVDSSELEAAISEDACWRQIKMTCDTENEELNKAFEFFCTQIQPQIQVAANALQKKLMANAFVTELPTDKYAIYLRSVANSLKLFKEENVPLQAELAVLQQQFGTINGKMTVTVNEKEYTLQQAAKFLESKDRILRKEVYEKINERRYRDREELSNLYDKLIGLRVSIAKNAGMETYTQYRFSELGRFDYTPTECKAFADAIKMAVLPLVNEIYNYKKEKLGLEVLKPYDVEAEPDNVKALEPFTTGEELLTKTFACFEQLDPFFANCLQHMQKLGHFDLESRKGKAPGGYNCPLAETGAPFIFMNAAGQMDDVTTMVHEGGHAVHSFLAHKLPLTAHKEYPMEIAEVASMAMELFSMDYWHSFFKDEIELKRAKIHQLERVITIFPWIAIIDQFQHWQYANPAANAEERKAAWIKLTDEYKNEVVSSEGYEHFKAYQWQRQLHLYEVPFYYIEYGIAQLGAIGLWKQFKENKEAALNNYCKALALGGTKTLPELYAAAGLQFNFGPAIVKEYMDFVHQELKQLMD